jgi:lipid-binding SYLF domain-containing protein
MSRLTAPGADATAPTPGLSRRAASLGAATAALAWMSWSGQAQAGDAADLSTDSAAALQRLYASSDKARQLGQKARAILVFPKIKKAGFMVGGQGGKGALFQGGRTVGYFSLFAGSFGLQAGVQTFSYALFFITQSALDYLKKSDGWAIGSGPSVVVVDEGFARTMNTTTLSQDVYAMPFGQKGLMAGLGLEGSKITRIHPT